MLTEDTIATDVPDAESIADELARVSGVLRDLLAYLRVVGTPIPATIARLEARLAAP